MTSLEFVGYARKFCIALVAAMTVTVVALVDNVVTPTEWVQIAIAFLGAYGVYAVNNSPAPKEPTNFVGGMK